VSQCLAQAVDISVSQSIQTGASPASGFTLEQYLGPKRDYLSPFTGKDKSTYSCNSTPSYIVMR
jgi:hypothetical protein